MALIRTKKRLSHRCLTIKKGNNRVVYAFLALLYYCLFYCHVAVRTQSFFHVVTCYGQAGARINVPQSGQLCCNGVATYTTLFDLHLSPLISHLSTFQLSSLNFLRKKEWIVQFAVCLAINNMVCALDFFSFGHL